MLSTPAAVGLAAAAEAAPRARRAAQARARRGPPRRHTARRSFGGDRGGPAWGRRAPPAAAAEQCEQPQRPWGSALRPGSSLLVSVAACGARAPSPCALSHSFAPSPPQPGRPTRTPPLWGLSPPPDVAPPRFYTSRAAAHRRFMRAGLHPHRARSAVLSGVERFKPRVMRQASFGVTGLLYTGKAKHVRQGHPVPHAGVAPLCVCTAVLAMPVNPLLQLTP